MEERILIILFLGRKKKRKETGEGIEREIFCVILRLLLTPF